MLLLRQISITKLSIRCICAFPVIFAFVSSFVAGQQHMKFQYHDTPRLLWKHQLAGVSLGPSNAVEQSPFDEEIIYITTQDATLVVLSTQDGSIVAEVSSPSRLGGIPSCQSGVSFGQLPNGSTFLIFTILRKTSATSNEFVRSQVMAVSAESHELIWSSEVLPGESMGSPIIIYEQQSRKPYIALTHNTEIFLADNSTATLGSFTLLDSETGNVLWTETEPMNGEEPPKGYGPLGVASNSIYGKYIGGEDNSNDLAGWATYDKHGRRNIGTTYTFQLPQDFDENVEGALARFSTVELKKVRWTTVTRPVFGERGLSMYFGVTKDEMRGWNGNNFFDETADWSLDLSVGATDPISFIPSTPAISLDGERLFVATSLTSFHGVDSTSGTRIWDFAGSSTFLSEPRVSPDNERVYFVQSSDGQLLSINQQDGTFFWSVSCNDFEEDCSKSVEANFAVSKSGQHIYYSDIFGNVMALEVGDFVPLDINEDENLGESKPAGSGSESREDTDIEVLVDQGHQRGTRAVFTVLGLLIAFGATVYLYLSRRDRKRRSRTIPADKWRQPPNKEHHLSNTTPQNHTMQDMFEDDVIFYPRSPPPTDYPNVGAERQFPLPLRGARRVAPFEEDFSLGAFVIV